MRGGRGASGGGRGSKADSGPGWSTAVSASRGRGGRMGGRTGRGGGRRYDRKADRQPSLTVQGDWVVVEEFDLVQLLKLQVRSIFFPTHIFSF